MKKHFFTRKVRKSSRQTKKRRGGGKKGARLLPILGAAALGLLGSTYAQPLVRPEASYLKYEPSSSYEGNMRMPRNSGNGKAVALPSAYPSYSPSPYEIMVPYATPISTMSFPPESGMAEDPSTTNFGSTWLEKIKIGQNELKSGKRESGDWCTSGKCNNGLGIRRRDMPQTGEMAPSNTRSNKPLNAYISDLEAEFGIEATKTKKSMNDLKPAQGEINKAKVEGMAKAIKNGKTLGGDPPVVSSDGYVIDGHHRWAAMKEAGKGNQKINVIELNAPAMTILTASAAQPQKNFMGTPVPYPSY